MKKLFSDRDDFYIGYLPTAPKGLASILMKFIFGALLGGVCLASLVAWHQKKFSPATFEYGIRTELEGYIFNTPIPHVMVPIGINIDNQQLFQAVLLVGFGKSGGKNTLRRLLNNDEPEGMKVQVDGTLIYGNGKTLLQIDQESSLRIIDDRMTQLTLPPPTEHVTMIGEIVDPKCFLGVMKPGEGKAHRSCAIRCIAGGIPPVFIAESGYYLLVDENNLPLAKDVLNIVGDRIRLEGQVMQWNDWKILRVDSNVIGALTASKKMEENMLAFQEGITQCK